MRGGSVPWYPCGWHGSKGRGIPFPSRYDDGMELRHLKTFVTAAEAGNFTRAAERLDVTQAAVSQHIAVLEAHYGQVLHADTH